jgi:hypothetical protein
LNVTLIVQVPPTATLVVIHVLVSEKLLPTAMLVKVRVAVPELVTVTDCAALVVPTAWLAKVREVGERVTAAAVAVPDKLTVCGLLLALSVIVRVPVTGPGAAGALNVTLIVQVPPAATLVVVHVLVSEKLLLAAMLVMVSVAFPELVTVTDCAVLAVPTGLEKVRELAERVTAGALGGELVVEPPPPPPPQFARTINPNRPARRQ